MDGLGGGVQKEEGSPPWEPSPCSLPICSAHTSSTHTLRGTLSTGLRRASSALLTRRSQSVGEVLL